MGFQEAMTSLADMKSRFNDGFSYSDRELLDSLHKTLFNKGITNTGCSDCYRDAYILIINKLKQTKEMPKQTSLYTLKAGAILRRPGSNRFYANTLPNDEVPEEYLAHNPADIVLFAAYPADWEARVARRAEGKLPEGEISQEDAKNIIAGLQSDLKKRDAEIETLKKGGESSSNTLSSLENEEIASLTQQLASLRADIEAAYTQIAELKAENSALKAKPTRRKSKSDK